MIYDLQKASMLKRISAYILDMILLLIVIVGVSALLSTILGYNGYFEEYQSIHTQYEEQYGVKFDITEEEYNKLPEDEALNFDNAYKALSQDERLNYVWTMIVNLSLIIVVFSVIFGFLILEFIIPLLLKNGQTVGKKIFSIAVMRTDGIKITAPVMFARTILGKCTIETLLPVFMVIFIIFDAMGILKTGLTLTAIIGLMVLATVQIIMLIVTKTNSVIHDKLADTVTVDLTSQKIFDTYEDMIEYKQRIAAEKAAKQEYK